MLPFRSTKIATALFVVFILLVLIYALYEARNIIAGPQILIALPADAAIVKTQAIEISGATKNISAIQLDGRDIFINEEGVFVERLLLAPGYNVFRFDAQDRFGRKTHETLELVYEPETLVTDSATIETTESTAP